MNPTVQKILTLLTAAGHDVAANVNVDALSQVVKDAETAALDHASVIQAVVDDAPKVFPNVEFLPKAVALLDAAVALARPFGFVLPARAPQA